MKVTIVVGGRWHAFDLAKELHAKGHLHLLITNYPKWFVRKWGIPQEKIRSLPITFFVVKCIYMLGGEPLMMKLQWRVHKWFADRATKYLEGSDIIHAWSSFAEPSLAWAQRRGIPTVLERSSAHIIEQSSLLRKEFIRQGMKWNGTHPKIEEMEVREYSLSTAIAVPSLFVERSFINRKVDDKKLFKNPLGVNLFQFRPSREPLTPPTECGLRVVYAGSLSIRKGIRDLLLGFLSSGIQDAKLTLIGGRSKDINNLFKEQHPHITELGHLPQKQLSSHYRMNHCFVLASVEEGMAMVQMQALACGLPLICTTNTGGEDLLRMNNSNGIKRPFDIIQFPAGFLVPIHSPDAIAYCLRSMANEQGLWQSMRRAALQLASQELSWENYAGRAIHHYKSLLTSG